MRRFVKITVRVILGLIVLYVALCAVGAVLAMRIPRLPLKGSPASVGLAYSNVFFHHGTPISHWTAGSFRARAIRRL